MRTPWIHVIAVGLSLTAGAPAWAASKPTESGATAKDRAADELRSLMTRQIALHKAIGEWRSSPDMQLLASALHVLREDHQALQTTTVLHANASSRLVLTSTYEPVHERAHAASPSGRLSHELGLLRGEARGTADLEDFVRLGLDSPEALNKLLNVHLLAAAEKAGSGGPRAKPTTNAGEARKTITTHVEAASRAHEALTDSIASLTTDPDAALLWKHHVNVLVAKGVATGPLVRLVERGKQFLSIQGDTESSNHLRLNRNDGPDGKPFFVFDAVHLAPFGMTGPSELTQAIRQTVLSRAGLKGAVGDERLLAQARERLRAELDDIASIRGVMKNALNHPDIKMMFETMSTMPNTPERWRPITLADDGKESLRAVPRFEHHNEYNPIPVVLTDAKGEQRRAEIADFVRLGIGSKAALDDAVRAAMLNLYAPEDLAFGAKASRSRR